MDTPHKWRDRCTVQLFRLWVRPASAQQVFDLADLKQLANSQITNKSCHLWHQRKRLGLGGGRRKQRRLQLIHKHQNVLSGHLLEQHNGNIMHRCKDRAATKEWLRCLCSFYDLIDLTDTAAQHMNSESLSEMLHERLKRSQTRPGPGHLNRLPSLSFWICKWCITGLLPLCCHAYAFSSFHHS